MSCNNPPNLLTLCSGSHFAPVGKGGLDAIALPVYYTHCHKQGSVVGSSDRAVTMAAKKELEQRTIIKIIGDGLKYN
jgi:hypothetical protein